MDALIDFTEEASSNLSKELKREEGMNMNKIELLKQKLVDSIENNNAFVAYISSPSFEIRNVVCPDDFSTDDNYLYLSDGNYEVHINMDEVELKYDDTIDVTFILEDKNVEVGLVFSD